EQLPTGTDGTAQQPIGRFRTGLRSQVMLKVLEELAAALPHEQPPALVLPEAAQVADSLLGGVVQVCGSLDRVLLAFEDAEEIRQVLAVPAYLEHRMQPRPAGAAVHGDELVVTLPALGRTPLLQLDEDVRVTAR